MNEQQPTATDSLWVKAGVLFAAAGVVVAIAAPFFSSSSTDQSEDATTEEPSAQVTNIDDHSTTEAPTPSATPTEEPPESPTNSPDPPTTPPVDPGTSTAGDNYNEFWVDAENVKGDPGGFSINGNDVRTGYLESSSCFQCTGETEASVEIDLNRDYSRFTALLGLEDSSRADEEVGFYIYADGALIYEGKFSLGESEQIELSVNDTLRLKFVFTGRLSLDRVKPAVGDPLVFK
ncbi:NPCBM/NEW2 domain-containing protein [Glycomyces sp. A-F 0318]|uniref:NPCBM/NEW2 domain-containing protein n=1 Tax=Glycomyces amatae TaxID=2881355 RepID=UPI001E3E39BA|nr:NPCBM/NEW2 domain-containing protein [Glycomyces amatae]MCD0445797.1 NPCBM/NEW2 domain-containing protein [Glycomyces amatae]